MKCRIVISVFTLLLLCLFGITAYADSPVTPKNSFDYRGTEVLPSVSTRYKTSKAFFRDEAELLTDAQQKEIWEKLRSVTDDSDLKIAVFLGGNYRSDSETENFTNACAAQIFGDNTDSLFIYLDFEGRSPAYDYIHAHNKADRIFSRSVIDKILDSMYEYLPASGDPVYSADVSKALITGIDALDTQYRKSTELAAYSGSSSQESYNGKTYNIGNIMSLISGLNVIFVLVAIGLVILLILILIFIFSLSGGSSHRSSYYGGSSYYRDRPYRSHRSHRPSSSRSHRSSSHSSSRSSGSGGSGSGRHR